MTSGTGDRGPPCLFLSHSGVDSEAAKELKRLILATPAAREAGLEVWLDKDDLLPGVEGWQEQIEKALTRRATAFAVLVGSKGVVNWVDREVRIALSRATGADPIPFIPVLSKDAPGVEALRPFAQKHQGVTDPAGEPEALKRLVAAALDRLSIGAAYSTPEHTICLTRKNALFAGHEIRAENWVLLSSVVATCKLNDVNPIAYLTETLDAIINGHPQSRIEELMPWRFRKTSSPNP